MQPLAVDWRQKLKGKGSQSSGPAAATTSPPSTTAQAASTSDLAASVTADGKPDLNLLSKGLPAGWRAMWDKNTGDIYYGNIKTRVRISADWKVWSAKLLTLAQLNPLCCRVLHRDDLALCIVCHVASIKAADCAFAMLTAAVLHFFTYQTVHNSSQDRRLFSWWHLESHRQPVQDARWQQRYTCRAPTRSVQLQITCWHTAWWYAHTPCLFAVLLQWHPGNHQYCMYMAVV